MNNLSNLLAIANGWQGRFGGDYQWMSDIFGALSLVLWIIFGIVGAVGAIYAIWLGIQLARAESDDKRTEAKNHLITVIIAVAVTLALVLFFNYLLPLIIDAFIAQPESLKPKK